MAGLRELADQLGLSITTVSRALDGYDDVAAATKLRVREAADAAGYRPNPTARRLRKGASESIALIMPTEPGRFFEAAFVDLLAVIGERFAARHYDLVLMAARPGAEEGAAYARLVRERRADAFILVRTRRRDERVAFLQAQGIPFVCHGRTETPAPYACVDGDGEAGFHALTQRLIGLGHRRIAHLGAPEAFTFAGFRAQGWRRALQEAGLAAGACLAAAPTEAGGEARAAALLAGADRPTAILCATDRIAIGAIRAAQALGLAVGRDVAIAGHDNIHAASHTTPALTTMELDARAVGERLADMALALVGGASPEGLQQVFTPRQIARASTGEG